MIELYAKGTTDFSSNGIRLHPKEATVTFQENGRFDLEVVIPAGHGYQDFDYGQILKTTVPHQHLDAVSLGMVTYWSVINANGTNLYSEIPTQKNISYTAWSISADYAVGSKVSIGGKNWRCTFYDETSPYAHIAPPQNTGWWTEIPSSTGNPGKVAATLAQGAVIMKTGDFNTTYMEASSMDGKSGYIVIADCVERGDTEERILPERDIQEQQFTIVDIRKEQKDHSIRITAEHISYQLGRTMVGDCKVANVNPATALMFLAGAMKEAYGGGLYTNVSDVDITADWSWKNAQNALLDPKNGLVAVTNGKLIRDNLDWILLEDTSVGEFAYSVRYGSNMQNVRWSGNVDSLITRVYPLAQREDGETLLLPEEHIDSVLVVPFVRPETLDTKLKIGETITDSDGTETTLTEDEVYTRMREMAQNRFNIDRVDEAEVNLDLDWVHMPDTEEYAQYISLRNAAPGDLVNVVNGPLGINVTIRLTGYSWDPITEKYKKTTFGSIKTKPTVSGYNLKSGSVTASAIARGAVGGENIKAGSITAREIEANSITAEKIASKSIVTELLAANAVTADEINANAITTEKLAANSITAVKIAANAITSDKIQANAITSEKIDAGAITARTIAAGAVTAGAIDAGAINSQHIATETITANNMAAGAITAVKLAAGAVTADKVDAGAITAEKIAAYAVTAEKLAAGAVTADKIDAGAITAVKISTTDIDAINAKLGTASIADARIALADIDYAKVKDLNAQSAYFGQAVIQEGLANKLFIPRLAVDYAQIVSATIGDLVIQATDDKYYKLDVDLSGNVTATEVHPTAEEIEDGHTTDGRKIYTETSIVASDLSTTNIYASHALMDEITANVLNVDSMFAREATIGKINALDLSSNTYIRSVVGDWVSGSTITQTINGINTRITSLGSGTFYYSETEPSHEGLVAGDVWIQPGDDNTWGDIGQMTWGEIQDNDMTWDDVAGKYKMYAWTGTRWKLLYDSRVNADLQTQIDQNAYAITLKADETVVDSLSDQVTEFGATLSVQAEEIEAAVSSVNAKTANYVQSTDPSLDHVMSMGDMWTKGFGTGKWGGLSSYTWGQLSQYTWGDLAGPKTYIWNGTGWILSSDRAMELETKAAINVTDRTVKLMAQEQLILGDEIYRNYAQILVQADRITQEVARATAAENGKIAKTTQYQTADAIVSEAVAQSSSAADGTFIKKTTQYQTADSIVTEAVSQASSAASGIYLQKTTQYQDAESIVTEAVSRSGTAAGDLYIAKTETMQTAEQIKTTAVTEAYNMYVGNFIAQTSRYHSASEIVDAAETYVDGELTNYSTTTQTATMINSVVGTYVDGALADYSTTEQTATAISAYVHSNAYEKESGISITAEGVDVSGNKHINLDVNIGNYVHISSEGIDMMGSRVSVNGKDMWARDDILVLKKTDNEQAVIDSMVGHHDWVLIKPYYDATVDYAYSSDYTVNNIAPIVAFARTSNTSFADSGASYTYTISGYAETTSPGVFALSCDVRLSNYANQAYYHTLQLRDIQLGGNAGTFTYTGIFTAGANLCGEGQVMYVKIVPVNNTYRLSNLKLHCTTDSATSKVPCTVYYFP